MNAHVTVAHYMERRALVRNTRTHALTHARSYAHAQTHTHTQKEREREGEKERERLIDGQTNRQTTLARLRNLTETEHRLP